MIKKILIFITIVSLMVILYISNKRPIAVEDAWRLSEEEVATLSTKANNKDAEAAFQLYLHFKTIKKDNQKALFWLEKAAALHHASAEYNLAKELENNIGDKEHYKKALYWYQKASKDGIEKAQDDIERIKKY